MDLIITEKHSQGEFIAETLLDSPSADTYYDHTYWIGDTRTVLPLQGHIYELTNTESRGEYPSFPPLQYEPMEGRQQVHNLLEREMADADEIVVATDYDREGELIGVLAVLIPDEGPESIEEFDGIVSRMEFSALTEDDIETAYTQRGSINEDLYYSGLARSIIDYHVGINFSDAITKALLKARGKYTQLSSGRVQSPLLKIVHERCAERREFDPDTYWTPSIEVDGVTLTAPDIYDEDDRDDLEDQLQDADTVTVTDVSESTWQNSPPDPLNLPTAQKRLGSIYGSSASQVLDNIQSLYQDSYVTYPRTENQQYPGDFDFASLTGALESRSPFDVPDFDSFDPTRGDKYDEAHPPITPTTNVPYLDDLNKWVKLTYIFVAKHFLATLMDAAVKRRIEYTVEVAGTDFDTTQRMMVSMGYLDVYGRYGTVYDDDRLGWDEDDTFTIDTVEFEENETSPPNRYTTSSIIGVMESEGLGTSATRGNIVDKLFTRTYVKSQRSLETTPLGDRVVEVLSEYAPTITDPKYTAELEDELEGVRQGEMDHEDAIEDAKAWVREVCEAIRAHEEEIGVELREAFHKEDACPECGGDLYTREHQGDFFWGCENYAGKDDPDSCTYTEDI